MFEKFNGQFEGKDAIIVKGLGAYSLADTMECGQCFRYEKIERTDGIDEYITVVKEELIRVAQKERGELIFLEMTEDAFAKIAAPYFSLERDLNAVRDSVRENTDSEWLRTAADFGAGIAILSQEPWEALMSFISRLPPSPPSESFTPI